MQKKNRFSHNEAQIKAADNFHCGEPKTQRKCFLDEKRDGLVDENRVNNKKNKNNRAVFMFFFFLLII